MAKRTADYEQFLETLCTYGCGVTSTSSIPLYYQLYMILERGIRDRALQSGDRFPPEEAVAEHFSVSRPTANRAIQELIKRGWLTRKRGRGTFVQRAAPTQLSLLSNSLSFSDEIGKREDHRTRFVRRAAIAATEEDAAALDTEPGAPLHYIRRLHHVGQPIVMVCDSKLPATRFPDLLDGEFVEDSLFRTLHERYGCRVSRAERCVEAAEVLDAEVADLLQIPLFAPILLMTGLTFDDHDSPVEAMTAYVREGVMFKSLITADPASEPPMPERSATPIHHATNPPGVRPQDL